jgi:molecular chaperone DnaK
MARLGIDFGTTNTVAVAHDRGVFSAVLHQARTNAGVIVQEVFPSAILIEKATGQRHYGLDAERRFAQLGPSSGCIFIPSLKSQLRHYSEGRGNGDARGTGHPASLEGNGHPAPRAAAAEDLDLFDLLTGFLTALADSIRQSAGCPPDEPLETVITWPANANGAQRHVTRKCFRAAGFEVTDTLNEPTASAIELADCLTAGRKKAAKPSAVAVFDFGGGTFDASVVWIDGNDFHVFASSGIESLGGDDLDAVLLEMFLEKLALPADSIGAMTRHALLRQVRSQKEMISTGTMRSLFLNPFDFGLTGRPVSIPLDAYDDRVRPMLEPAIARLREVIAAAAARQPGIEDGPDLTIYLVGGSSKLPLVARMVSDAFPDSRVMLTDKPFRSVAMGAAICATDRVTYRDVFARHFGLIRLREHGQLEVMDTIFPAGTPIPRRGEPPLERMAWYRPAHNIGHLRYLECSSIGSDGLPADGARAWSDILFPYDPACPLTASLSTDQILATDRFGGEPVCEVYRCDNDGVITVELRRPSLGDSRCYEIFRD